MNLQFPHLLAIGIDEIVTAVFVLGSLAVWVISQIADAKKKQQAQQQRQPAGPPPGPGGPPAAAQDQAQPLRAQVDEFLRRAGQQGQPPDAKPAARRDEIELLVGNAPDEPVRQQLAKPLRPMGETAVPGMPNRSTRKRLPRRRGPEPPQSVAEHVASHVGAAVTEIRQEVSHLGEAVITADKQFDVQLQQKFDHQLGSLRQQQLTPLQDPRLAPPVDTPASQIVAMLTNPAGVRQAIVVNEILRRPEDRW